jgi:hypothetical protein
MTTDERLDLVETMCKERFASPELRTALLSVVGLARELQKERDEAKAQCLYLNDMGGEALYMLQEAERRANEAEAELDTLRYFNAR